MPLKEDSDIGAKIWLRHLRSRTAKAGKTSLQKVNLRFFNLHRDYSNSLILSGKKYAHSFGIEFLRALYSSSRKKKVWCTCKIVLLLIKPIVFLKFLLPHRRPPYCLPTHPRKKLTLHTLDFISLCVLNERIRETSMEPKFSSLKLSADIPPKTFFGKLSTLENIVTGDEGKKSSDQKKIIQQKTHKKSKFRYRKRKNSNI